MWNLRAVPSGLVPQGARVDAKASLKSLHKILAKGTLELSADDEHDILKTTDEIADDF